MPITTRRGPRSILHAVGSLWFAAVLLVLWLVAMACATVFESTHGTGHALAVFYHSLWFELLLALAGANVLGALLLCFPFSKRQLGFVLTHASLLVTFGGALVTKHFGVEGQVGIFEGQTADHFITDDELLFVENRADHSHSSINLSDVITNPYLPTDFRARPTASLADLRVEIVRYWPDSEWERNILDDNPMPQPAIEISLSSTGRAGPVWVFAEQPASVAGMPISFRLVADPAELARLISTTAASQPSSKGTVRIEYEGVEYEFSVEQGLEAAVPLGETGYTAQVLRYLPHATVGADNQIVKASDRPVNPYIEVGIAGPDINETRRAFAKFPDFGAMHGRQQVEGLKLTFAATAAEEEPFTPVEVLAGSEGELYVRFRHQADTIVSRKLELDVPVDSPWPGLQFIVLRRYDHARADWTLTLIEPVRKKRTAAILLRLRDGEHDSELWVQKLQRRSVMIGAVPYEVSYRDESLPLGFSLKLDRFRLGYYPGGRRPRSFESHVTVTEPSTARTQSRVISMNHPVSFGAYTLYQSSYRQERDQTVSFLSVSRDPGQPIVFAGYIGVILGMIVVLVTRMRESRHTT